MTAHSKNEACCDFCFADSGEHKFDGRRFYVVAKDTKVAICTSCVAAAAFTIEEQWQRPLSRFMRGEWHA